MYLCAAYSSEKHAGIKWSARRRRRFLSRLIKTWWTWTLPSKSSSGSLTERASTLAISIMCSVIEMAKIMKETASRGRCTLLNYFLSLRNSRNTAKLFSLFILNNVSGWSRKSWTNAASISDVWGRTSPKKKKHFKHLLANGSSKNWLQLQLCALKTCNY